MNVIHGGVADPDIDAALASLSVMQVLDLGNLAPQSQSLDIHNQTNVYIW